MKLEDQYKDISKKGRHEDVVFMRRMISWLGHESGLTFPEIAYAFRGKPAPHSTILERCKIVKTALKNSADGLTIGQDLTLNRLGLPEKYKHMTLKVLIEHLQKLVLEKSEFRAKKP